MNARYRVGIDIGGTFTDFVLLDEHTGDLALHKRLTTPHDPAEGALAGLRELLRSRGLNLAEVGTIVHGTTLVTNAIIERRGVPTALLTTAGFRDILEMGHEQRYDIYDLFLRFPEPLVPRRLRLEVPERMSRDGRPLTPPDLDVVRRHAETLVQQGVQAVAVCFLHAYRNPVHERAVAELLRREYPQLWVSVSSEVVPEIREYERTTTTVCNAYVGPIVDRYLERLERALADEGFRGRLFLMQSAGGLMAPDVARRFPVRLLESGPAGGALVAAYLGRRMGLPDVLAFDMGGTTAKACLVRNGRPDVAPMLEAARVHRFKRGSGIPVKTPVVDLIEIGAGGGSIARTDDLGLLKVGPESAGADPGPACYGRGGTRPTVTDACLVLGYFDPDYFLGGRMRLDREAAERALAEVGGALGLSTTEAAWGVYSIVCENMASAARVYTIEKGQDPRRFPLIAFGGAGPAHAARVARILGAPEVIVPPLSGVASTLGFLVAPASFDFARSYPARLGEVDWAQVQALYDEMEETARSVLAAAGVAAEAVQWERWADMRLVGQFHEIRVPVPQGRLDAAAADQLAAAFADEYRRLYHAVLEGYEPMVLNWRLTARGPEPRVRLGRDLLPVAGGAEGVDSRIGAAAPPPHAHRRAYFPETGGHVEAPVYRRHQLAPGVRIEGPALVEEAESTTVVNPGDVLWVDEAGNLRIRVVSGR